MKLKEIGRIGLNYVGHSRVVRSVFYYNADNQFHNSEGPAYMNNRGVKEWWIEGIRIKDNYKEIYPL